MPSFTEAGVQYFMLDVPPYDVDFPAGAIMDEESVSLELLVPAYLQALEESDATNVQNTRIISEALIAIHLGHAEVHWIRDRTTDENPEDVIIMAMEGRGFTECVRYYVHVHSTRTNSPNVELVTVGRDGTIAKWSSFWITWIAMRSLLEHRMGRNARDFYKEFDAPSFLTRARLEFRWKEPETVDSWIADHREKVQHGALLALDETGEYVCHLAAGGRRFEVRRTAFGLMLLLQRQLSDWRVDLADRVVLDDLVSLGHMYPMDGNSLGTIRRPEGPMDIDVKHQIEALTYEPLEATPETQIKPRPSLVERAQVLGREMAADRGEYVCHVTLDDGINAAVYRVRDELGFTVNSVWFKVELHHSFDLAQLDSELGLAAEGEDIGWVTNPLINSGRRTLTITSIWKQKGGDSDE